MAGPFDAFQITHSIIFNNEYDKNIDIALNIIDNKYIELHSGFLKQMI